MCGYCDRNQLGDVQRSVVHHSQETYFHADGEEVRIIGWASNADGTWADAIIVRKSSSQFALAPHFISDSRQCLWGDLLLTAPAAIIPAEHDAAEHALIQERYRLEDRRDAAVTRMHHLAGDKRDWIGRRQVWRMSDTEAESACRRAAQGVDPIGEDARKTLRSYGQACEKIHDATQEIAQMEATWAASGRWTRWFPCLNADGHIHRSLSGCPTVNRGMSRTSMGWATELSGKTVAEAIAELGPTLCSVCFPDAPVEHCQSRRDITRAEREAEKAQKDQARLEAERARTAAAAERQARRDAAPKKVTAAERRMQAINAVITRHDGLAASRDEIAADIEKLAALGKTDRWQAAIARWAKEVRENESLRWALLQLGQAAVWAAE